jgi:hypothetical protein
MNTKKDPPKKSVCGKALGWNNNGLDEVEVEVGLRFRNAIM